MHPFKLITGFIGVLLLAAIAYIAQDWRLWQRYLIWPTDATDPATVMWHEPKSALGSGAGRDIPSAAAADLVIDPEVLQTAWDYAEEKGTQALIIAHDGIIQLENYAPGMDPSSLFQSQSMHKGLTAVVLGAAIQSGAIPSKDSLASDYLAEWRDDPVKNQATLADLAYMQAGLERSPFSLSPFSPGAALFLSGHVAERALSTASVAEPGEHFIWSNASTQALSVAIERATGQPWADFLREQIWTAIGGGEAYVSLDRPGGNALSFCCLASNARNWLRIGQLLLDDGVAQGQRILADGWVREMTTGASSNANYGMQLWVNEPYTGEFVRMTQPYFTTPRSGRLAAADAFFIEGHFAQRLYVVPSRGLVVVRFGEDVLDWDDAGFLNPLIDTLPDRSRPPGPPMPAVPQQSFADSTPPPAPDYSRIASWGARPDTDDAADVTPAGVSDAQNQAPVDAFYIYPTTYRGATWNAAWDDPAVAPSLVAILNGQASVLNGCCAVFAPFYRQATAASVGDRTGSGMQAFGLAYTDVRAAFEHFVSERSRPFVLLGHSQGAFHARRLLEEVIVGTTLAERLVAAYIIGIPLPMAAFEDTLQGLEPCTAAGQRGCVAAWSTYGPGADPSVYQQRNAQRFQQFQNADGTIDLLCINPLTGTTNAKAGSAANLGGVGVGPAPFGKPAVGLTGANCIDGMLRLDRTPGPPFRQLVFGGENYHFYDIALFYMSLRQDLLLRVAGADSG